MATKRAAVKKVATSKTAAKKTAVRPGPAPPPRPSQIPHAIQLGHLLNGGGPITMRDFRFNASPGGSNIPIPHPHRLTDDLRQYHLVYSIDIPGNGVIADIAIRFRNQR